MQYFKKQDQIKFFDLIGLIILGFIVFFFGIHELNEPTQKKDPGVYDVSISVDEMQRWFKVIIPSQYTNSEKRPLLNVFH